MRFASMPVPKPENCNRKIKPKSLEQRARAMRRATDTLHDEFARININPELREKQADLMQPLWDAILVVQYLSLTIDVMQAQAGSQLAPEQV